MNILLNYILVIYYYYIVFFYELSILKLDFFILVNYFNNLIYFNLLFGLNSDMFLNFLLFDYNIVIFVKNEQEVNFFFSIMNFLFLIFIINYKYIVFLFIVFFLFYFKYKKFIYNLIFLCKEMILFGIFNSYLNKYFFFKNANYNFIYQVWYKIARNQKNTYLSIKFRLVYLTNKFIKQEFFNDNMFKDDVQEYFVLRRKTFFDSHFRPVKIRKFLPIINLKRKFYTKRRQNYALKGLLFFYLKDYEDRINKKEQQQKTLRIYEGIYGSYIYQELIKKNDQKQAKFVKMKLHRE